MACHIADCCLKLSLPANWITGQREWNLSISSGQPIQKEFLHLQHLNPENLTFQKWFACEVIQKNKNDGIKMFKELRKEAYALGEFELMC